MMQVKRKFWESEELRGDKSIISKTKVMKQGKLKKEEIKIIKEEKKKREIG